ncbi:MMPL family transporter [Lachnospiraceae bacterium BX10]|jgi:predicted RND superfamily exporter protein|uniref:MMPL family transporter n=2 Tax=Enterocloster hominis (ex Liu et al. 2021) TaxID=2763663 RepID=A0ABR7NUY3_9FIRM|nr:MMPL family transporter [Enterocloster hominis]
MKAMLKKMAHFIVQRGRIIEKFFIAMTILCAVCYPFVGVNYDLSKYLPDFAPTKQALDVMEQEFGYPGMARIMVKDVTLPEARTIRQRISRVDGVDLVVGPDLAANVYSTDAFIKNSLTDRFYKDGNAVYQIIFEDGDSDASTHKAINEIYGIVGKDRGCFAGSAVSSKERQESITREIAMAIGMAVVIIWLILTLTTTSWFEPFLFILVMAVAIVLNMGSNIMFGRISFFTFSTAAILQLAVSMDYSIFLLHTYTAIKQSGVDSRPAMEAAIEKSCSSILASGATTIVGFLVIALMKFTIGRDVGFVLTKGIVCSLVTVLFLMPTLILRFDKKIEKTAHRSFLPPLDGLGKLMYRIRIPVLAAAAFCAVPCYFGQSMNYFYYGDDALGSGPGTRVYEDSRAIEDVFGKSNVIIAMVPNGNVIKERRLTEELEDQEFIDYALSMAGTLPQGIPESFLPETVTKQLRTGSYARILISMENREESSYSFQCSEKLTEIVKKYYPEDSYVIGMTPTTMDIRDILTDDYNRVSIISLAGVALVVMLTFHSVMVPVLVIIPIEVAIYLNMTIPYIIGDSMVYIGYIIVSCLQLGATIDYSILMTNNYMEFRETMGSREAAVTAIAKSAISILTSGGILTVVGYLLYFTSSIQAISQVGRLVGRGALLSMILVLSLLPALLAAFDKPIRRQQQRAVERRARRMARPGKQTCREGQE